MYETYASFHELSKLTVVSLNSPNPNKIRLLLLLLLLCRNARLCGKRDHGGCFPTTRIISNTDAAAAVAAYIINVITLYSYNETTIMF